MEEQQQNARGGLRPSQMLMVGGMLFSMFFGAGNLILPPLLGLQAGTEAVPAMAGFLLAGIGLPVLGIVAVALCGGVRELAGRVSPLFASVFIALVYLTIGPFLAIPRTSSTAYEMLRPLLPGPDVIDPNVLRFSPWLSFWRCGLGCFRACWASSLRLRLSCSSSWWWAHR